MREHTGTERVDAFVSECFASLGLEPLLVLSKVWRDIPKRFFTRLSTSFQSSFILFSANYQINVSASSFSSSY